MYGCGFNDANTPRWQVLCDRVQYLILRSLTHYDEVDNVENTSSSRKEQPRSRKSPMVAYTNHPAY
ncbi:hypothetical protein CERZMDRAFT_91489, partial [Cercospora zeae-maydis SCOH1-5]